MTRVAIVSLLSLSLTAVVLVPLAESALIRIEGASWDAVRDAYAASEMRRQQESEEPSGSRALSPLIAITLFVFFAIIAAASVALDTLRAAAAFHRSKCPAVLATEKQVAVSATGVV